MATEDVHAAAAQCPVFHGFDPMAHPEQLREPGLSLEPARRETPVFFMPEYGFWVMTRYADVRAALRDQETFSSALGIRVPDVPPEYVERLPYFPVKFAQPAGLDDPAHARVRKVAQQGFTQSAVRAREGDMREIAERAIDEFVAAGRVDVIPAYAEVIPMQIAATMLGASADAVPKLRQWTRDSIDLMVETLEGERMAEVCERMIEFDAFMRELIAERRQEPRDDVLSLLVHAELGAGEPALDEAELIGLASVILTGGTDTTGGLIGRMLHQLLRRRELWEEVAGDRELVPVVVEEALRKYPIVHRVMRQTTREVEVGGTTVPAGAAIILHLDSSNRDSSTFANPDEFDIHRPQAELTNHLALGKGKHFCLGAPFARPMARIALDTLLDRIPGLALADPAAEPEIFRSIFVGGPTHLEVVWDPSEVPIGAAA